MAQLSFCILRSWIMMVFHCTHGCAHGSNMLIGSWIKIILWLYTWCAHGSGMSLLIVLMNPVFLKNDLPMDQVSFVSCAHESGLLFVNCARGSGMLFNCLHACGCVSCVYMGQICFFTYIQVCDWCEHGSGMFLFIVWTVCIWIKYFCYLYECEWCAWMSLVCCVFHFLHFSHFLFFESFICRRMHFSAKNV